MLTRYKDPAPLPDEAASGAGRAVTTVGGNADVSRCTENALRLLHAYGRDDVPVAEGAAGALLGSIVRASRL